MVEGGNFRCVWNRKFRDTERIECSEKFLATKNKAFVSDEKVCCDKRFSVNLAQVMERRQLRCLPTFENSIRARVFKHNHIFVDHCTNASRLLLFLICPRRSRAKSVLVCFSLAFLLKLKMLDTCARIFNWSENFESWKLLLRLCFSFLSSPSHKAKKLCLS